MRDQIHQVLKEYWGFTSFRPLQEDIIQSVLTGRDTLALLPTGGGKSICFQVPAMVQKGIAVVVSPLIALMNDQVQNLKARNIPAIALTSGLTYRELDLGLDNCVHGRYKFLYLSPERLKSELVQERLKRMKVNLLVVDEAHCISQWGYDFRPPYLSIAEVRKLLSDTPVLALTATATPAVVEDIQDKLAFREKKLLKKSFYRPNLSYNVHHSESKWSKTLEILSRIRGSGIIYVRNRKATVEIAQWLRNNNVSADFYHAGLETKDRNAKQEAWLKGRSRIMVCTNAFGMGIDKPDVRTVLHLDLPESLEAYFQEAGRAGRDGQAAYSVVLVGPSDLNDLKGRYLNSFPDIEFIRKLYQALGNYLQVATGTGEGSSFSFNFGEFIRHYDLPALTAYQALQIMEKEGLLGMSENFSQPSRVMLQVSRTHLYDFQLRNPQVDVFIKTLVRSYGGLDVEYTSISEYLLASRLKTSVEKVKQALMQLKKQGIIDYLPQHNNAEIYLHVARQQPRYLTISNENLKDRLKDRQRRVKSVEDYISNENTCRSRSLLAYFGEASEINCGRCDVCRSKEAGDLYAEEFERLKRDFLASLDDTTSLDEKQLLERVKGNPQKKIEALRWLIDSGEIIPEEGLLRKN